MRLLVMKFGGNALGATAALELALRVTVEQAARWDRVLLVVSALDGVTDMLLEAAALARVADQRGYRRIAANLRSRHLALIEQFTLDDADSAALQADIDKLLSDLLNGCQAIGRNLADELSMRESDEIVAAGERLSARIVAALLRQRGLPSIAVDGADVLVTDEVFGNANPDSARTAARVHSELAPMLERGIAPVVSGFIGSTPAGETTTLGRGGTDVTASVLSAALGARELWLWTDVDGMMTADPRVAPGARIVSRLDYQEAADLAYFGARILHSRMIAPLAESRVPLRVKNIHAPAGAGTWIAQSSEDSAPSLKAVTAIEGLALRRPAAGSLAGVTRLVGNTLFKTLGMRAEVMISSQSSQSSFLCLVIPTSIGIDGVDRLRRGLEAKMAEYPQKMPWRIETVALVTVIGQALDRGPRLLAWALGGLEGLELYALALGASGCSFSVALPLSERERALRCLHERIIRSGSDSAGLPTP